MYSWDCIAGPAVAQARGAPPSRSGGGVGELVSITVEYVAEKKGNLHLVWWGMLPQGTLPGP